MAKTATYEVRTQGGLHAVIRKGPRGGTRLINVYHSSYIAQDVAEKLTKTATWEA